MSETLLPFSWNQNIPGKWVNDNMPAPWFAISVLKHEKNANNINSVQQGMVYKN